MEISTIRNNDVGDHQQQEEKDLVLTKKYESEGILLVTINRPTRRNACDKLVAQQLHHHFSEFDRDDDLKVAILYGGEDYFCSGADLKEIASRSDRVNVLEEDGDMGPMGPTRLLLSKPVIAAINGYCVAGGLELALWCDLRVCSTDSIFGVFCRRFGVPLIDGGTIRLPRLIGQSRALDLILTGRAVSGKEAFEIGLANRVVPKGQVLETSLELAKTIASFPQECMKSDRRSVYDQFDLSINEALRNEFKLGYKSLVKEGETNSKQFKQGVGRHGSFNSSNNLKPKL
eukprot:gene6202-7724_t